MKPLTTEVAKLRAAQHARTRARGNDGTPSPRPAAKPAAEVTSTSKAEAPGKLPVGVRTLALEDLDVLPPVRRAAKPGAPMPLTEIEENIRALDARIDDRTRGYHNEVIYDIVGKGLMLLKGREAHLAQESTQFKKRGVETVSTPSAKQLAKIGEQGERGFLAWLGEKFEGQSTRTARNYMNAARNAGLTSDHTLADVEALRQTAALHEKKPTDLYRLADALQTPALPDKPEPVANIVAQTFAEAKTGVSALVAQRDQMEPEVYETAWTWLKSELETFTGRAWCPLEDRPFAEAQQHGELHPIRHKGAAKTSAIERWKNAKKGAKRK